MPGATEEAPPVSPVLIKTIVYGLLLGCMFTLNAMMFTGKPHWPINLFMGLVVMGLASLTDKLIPGIGVYVTFGLGCLAAFTVKRG
jgi:hypothetical protein